MTCFPGAHSYPHSSPLKSQFNWLKKLSVIDSQRESLITLKAIKVYNKRRGMGEELSYEEEERRKFKNEKSYRDYFELMANPAGRREIEEVKSQK